MEGEPFSHVLGSVAGTKLILPRRRVNGSCGIQMSTTTYHPIAVEADTEKVLGIGLVESCERLQPICEQEIMNE